MSVFQNPFNCDVEELPPKFQLEVIFLNCNDMLKGKYQEKNLIDFLNAFHLVNMLRYRYVHGLLPGF